MYGGQRTGFGSGSGGLGGGGGGGGAGGGIGGTGGVSAWADWAARNLDVDVQQTPVQGYVDRCCDPSLFEPNLALDLELADYVNQKKANTPREAAVETVKRINSRNPHVSMLALQLLDILVKNCGYPFQLQISTKEFLNELVKRFPERPPMFPSPVQSKVLELIHEWKQTICVTSKHKEDLVHIRDMHRLLSYKGYRFPDVDRRAAGVMSPENNLKSPEELEEEDRAAQAAKLQELIRRGTPRDLAQAQELMKIMAGAEPEARPDYRSQTRKELDKVQSRAILLNDMLNNASEGEKFARGDAYDQIASHIRSAQPRIQKWIGEAEEGESDLIDRLLLMNDLINQVVERYEAFKKGDFSATAEINPSIDPKKGGADAVPTAKITDLISFDDEPAPAPAASSSSTSILDDFASLTFGDTPAAASVAPSSSANANATLSRGPGGLPANLFDPSKMSQPLAGAGTAPAFGQWGALQLPTSSTSSAQGMSQSQSGTSLNQASLQPSAPGAQPATSQPATNANGQSKDPFADLDGLF